MDFVILTGDQAVFDPAFAPAVIVPIPGTIVRTARATSNQPAACVEGDEASVLVPGVPYTSPPFTGGIGTLTIGSLAADQVARRTTSGGGSG